MEDSPLSITASITGILTFIATIMAAIYVRYATLRNGEAERYRILTSVTSTLEGFRGYGEYVVIQAGDDTDMVWLKKLNASLIATQCVIASCCSMETTGASQIPIDLGLVGITDTAWAEAMQEIRIINENNGRKRSWISKAILALKKRYDRGDMTWKSITLLLLPMSLLSTPELMRWYQVRERVLEKIREQEILRSRITSHQIHMTYGLAKKQGDITRHILEEMLEHRNISLESTTRIMENVSGLYELLHCKDQIKFSSTQDFAPPA
ncbi:hypothetical protein PtrSN002B_009731 [Pyrenophora tritici-repentis]|uniref:Uncharacterized protein n=2 Tax=Pyrenophora tritici-repentis TaxID=45151 RepID=A0A2W1E7N0_9PLEO|nr:uncharacterized protein PTRG_03801 [Pyrenophora tritici-repentis Pt-1C-BFP]KAA8620146.1 hypothetical protein PtrV1_07240 [Pyrenophora tritici-repentis]EDU46639.1 predicted protein [Pyrenophora tritici-repentis Pt-1C-BFP]KAF7448297.1 hypothetical protein A1F99_076610 [Pyrenophora tritici-repentis]KAF7572015.1 hypothetical protein PtrM4_095150 [Pyrenophora tritici-repentis]KAG9384799.1 hypothetical protein A1F94_004346 [Pyrenophora tritici-repentis]